MKLTQAPYGSSLRLTLILPRVVPRARMWTVGLEARLARISERRVAEWWEAPGIDGREAYDEEILYLNSLAEELDLPRWALAVRDLMPRWGFQPCDRLFTVGVEQIIGMIGQGRAGTRVGGCGVMSLDARLLVAHWGRGLLKWSRGSEPEGPLPPPPGPLTPPQAEAARASGGAALALLQGHLALDEHLDRWASRARYPLTKVLVDGEDAPLSTLFRHPCCYNLEQNLSRVAQGIAANTLPQVRVCNDALLELPQLDPFRIQFMRELALTLVKWWSGKPPTGEWEVHVHHMLGEKDPTRRWLVASLYKCLKLWLQFLDRLHQVRHRYPALV